MSLTHSEWRANRRKYIGGSDAAPAIGKSQWRTPRDVYFSKVEGVHDEPTDAMRRVLEL
jgi:predicted phage-related endonuclease